MSAVGMVGVWVTAVGCGVMAGVYFTFSGFVMRALSALGHAEGIAAMQSINRVILSSGFMPLFFGTSVASLALAIWGVVRWGQPGSVLLIGGGAIYVVGMFIVTAAFNVPLNNTLDAVAPTAPEASRIWSDYLQHWTLWNHLRTVCSLAGCALLLGAGWMLR